MKVASPLMKNVVYPCLATTGFFRRCAGDGPAVITYHGVLPAGYKSVDPDLDGGLVSAEAMRAQLRLLQTRYHVISPNDFFRWCVEGVALPPRSVLLTCDDGLKNTLTDMLAILQEAGVPCLFFVTGASLGEEASMLWYEELYLMLVESSDSIRIPVPEIGIDQVVAGRAEKRQLWLRLVEKLSCHDEKKRRGLIEEIRTHLQLPNGWSAKYVAESANARRFLLLNRGELRRLSDAGMEIGSHTVSHPKLSKMAPEMAQAEISESGLDLQQFLNRPVRAFAYPFGDPASVTQREIGMAEKAGYDCAFVNVGDVCGADVQRFAIPRVHVTANMTISEFEAHVSGFYQSLRRAVKKDAFFGAASDTSARL